MLKHTRRRNSSIPVGQGEAIRRKAGRFRVLIIGRANSGKTTILKKVCSSAEEPAIYDGGGYDRGLHEINNEMVFKSNPRFIFHDSRGFEAGNTTELKYVKDFIARRAEKKRLRDRVHVIWYCIPLNDSRPVTKAEDTFFAECGTGHVPVIVLFTKLDALDDSAYLAIKREDPGISHEEADEKAPIRSRMLFDEMVPNLRIFKSRYAPKNYVVLRVIALADMNLPEADCSELLEVTAAALDDDTLQLLFVATQQANLKLCTTHAIDKLLTKMGSTNKLSSKEVEAVILEWYPHILDVSQNGSILALPDMVLTMTPIELSLALPYY
ncbi:hypothetical protein H0H93_010101 [Arthromyces matolae]|nr:hypothetical protein H0H93_010101 [Arthromyces matolae]